MSYLVSVAVVGVDNNIYSDPDERFADRMGWSVYGDALALDAPVLWPVMAMRGFPGQAQTVLQPGAKFEDAVVWSGTQSGKVISGITYDANGAVLAACTVKAFRSTTVDNLLADTQEGPTLLSGAEGGYAMPLPNNDPHYLVGYKAGSPDVTGATLNTLVGA
jgi:hypothetical protein